MEREYNVVAFISGETSFYLPVEAETQGEAIGTLAEELRTEGHLTQKEIQKMNFLAAPADFHTIKTFDRARLRQVKDIEKNQYQCDNCSNKQQALGQKYWRCNKCDEINKV